jgi:two-component system cell cycle response regulator
MATGNQILIAPVGLPELEIRILTSMFLLSKSRQRSYAFAEEGFNEAHILMVNADNEDALARWRTIHATKPEITTVMVSQETAQDHNHYHLQRRLTISKVLQLLDQIALTELHIIANVSIGEISASSHASLDKQWANETRLHNTLAKPVADDKQAGRTQRVLVVDDSPTVRKQIELGLLPYRVAVDLAETGEQALEFVAAQAYDLVFLDVVLPGTDGYEVCKTIKKHPNTKRIPVVMLTGKSSPFDRVRGTLAGCDSYLTKPVENKTFQGVLQKYLTAPSQQGAADKVLS